MDRSSFSFDITYSDETGIWQNLWNSIKDQLNLYFASIKLKDNFTTITTLANFNIQMQTQSENSKFHLYLIKLNSINDLKNGVKERIIANLNLRKSYLIVLMDVENSENGMKNASKNLEKIRNELKFQEIKLLPVNTNSNKLIEITNDFFNFFKNLVSTEFNSVMLSHLKYNEEAKQSKNENIENTYSYLQNKINYINYLQTAEFWREILTCLEEDLFFSFDFLNNQEAKNENSFKEPFSFIEASEFSITKKLSKRNLSNFEYQQFIFYNLIRCSKSLRDFKKLNDYFILILSNIYSLKQYFKTKYHFLFWCYLFTSRMITFTKSMKSNYYSNYDEEMNTRTQLIIYYHMKKFMKNYSILTKCEIPNTKIFSKILQKNIKSYSDLNQEIMNILENYDNSELVLRESDPKYSNFLKEIEVKMDEKSRIFLNSKLKMLEEYLNIFDNIEKIHSELNQNRLTIKIQIEKLPLLILLKKYSAVKVILVNSYNFFKKEKWDFIYENIKFYFLIIINCLEKNDENNKVIINFINLIFQNFAEENNNDRLNNIDTKNEKISNEIISSYLKNSNYVSKINESLIQLTNILDVELMYVCPEERNENIIYVNFEFKNILNILLKIQNLTNIKLFFSKFIFIFQDEMERGNVSYEYYDEEFRELGEKHQITHLINMDILKDNESEENFKVNSVYSLSEIKFILKSGLQGIYKIHNREQKTKIIIKSNSLETRSILSHSWLNSKNEIKGINQIYFNTVYSLFLEFKNFDKFNFSNKKMKFLIKELKQGLELDHSKIFLLQDKYEVIESSHSSKEDLFYNLKKKISIQFNKIEFSDDIRFEDNLIILKFFFIITDNNYSTYYTKKIEVISIIDNKDENYNLVDNNRSLSNLPFIFREIHSIKVEHIFTLSHFFRRQKEKCILIQTSVMLNLLKNNAKICVLDSQEEELDGMQSVNLIRKINHGKITEINCDQSLYFDYFYEGNKFTYFYPKKDLDEKIFLNLNYPKFISITLQSDDQETNADGIRLFTECNLNVKITYFTSDDALIMIKVKENENWAIVGKTKVIESFYLDDNHTHADKNIVFRVIPLQDGYVRLPELEFMKYNIYGSSPHDFEIVNSLDFVPFDSPSTIDGNKKIIKVYSINSCALRLNMI